PTRLQEQRSQEDPEQDDAGNPRQGVGGVAHVPSPPNHQPTTQSRAANPPRVPQRPASRERLPRTPHAAATVSMAGKAQVSPCIRAPERSVTTGRSSSPSPPKSTVAPPNTQNGAQSAHRFSRMALPSAPCSARVLACSARRAVSASSRRSSQRPKLPLPPHRRKIGRAHV